jgi:hypothetical protein
MSVSQASISQALTSYVLQGLAKRTDFVGLEVAPEHGQDKLDGEYPVVALANGEMLRNNTAPRAPGALFKRIEAKIGLETTKLSGDGLEIPIPIEVARNSDIPIIGVYAEEAMLNSMRLHETRVAAISQGTGFDTVASTAAYTTANIATSDLAMDIQLGIDRVRDRGEYPDTIVIPQAVWTRQRFSTKLAAFIVGANGAGAMVTVSNLQKAFADEGIKRVLIGRSQINTAAKGKVDIGQIWANTHIWIGAGRDADTNAPGDSMRTAIKTFFWREIFNAPFFVEQYFEKKIESDIIRAWGYTNEKLVNARAGTRITTQYS